MRPREELHRIVDVPAEGSTTVRVSRAQDADTGANVVIISHGIGGNGQPFRRPAHCGLPIRLPASSLPDLRAALEALADDMGSAG